MVWVSECVESGAPTAVRPYFSVAEGESDFEMAAERRVFARSVGSGSWNSNSEKIDGLGAFSSLSIEIGFIFLVLDGI